MFFAVSSVNILFKKVFLTLKVEPDGMTPTVLGIGGSPSFCCKESATTKNALKPIGKTGKNILKNRGNIRSGTNEM